MGGTPTSRVIVHAMWISVAATIPAVLAATLAFNATDHDPDLGRGFGAAVAVMVLVSPFWVPPVVLGAVLIGASAAGVDRMLAGKAVGVRMLVAAVTGGLVGAAAMAGLLVAVFPGTFLPPPGSGPSLFVEIVIGVVIGAVGAGGGLLAADRSEGVEAVVRWGVAAAALAALAAFVGMYATWVTNPWWPADSCADRLNVRIEGVAFVSAGFPPQTWCVSLDAVQKWDGSWLGAVAWLAGAASLACAAIAAAGGWDSSRRPTSGVLTTVVAVIVVSLGVAVWAVSASPSAAQIDQARDDIRTHLRTVPSTSSPSSFPTGSATPLATPTISAELARTDQQRLLQLARASVGQEVQWPKQPHTSTSSCTLASGGSGVMIRSTAQFTTRDLADVHGADEMYALEHANEKVAAQIGDAWSDSGIVGAGEKIHGEWWFGGQSSIAIETAHLGFTNGIGELLITSYCAHR